MHIYTITLLWHIHASKFVLYCFGTICKRRANCYGTFGCGHDHAFFCSTASRLLSYCVLACLYYRFCLLRRARVASFSFLFAASSGVSFSYILARWFLFLSFSFSRSCILGFGGKFCLLSRARVVLYCFSLSRSSGGSLLYLDNSGCGSV